MLPNDKRRGLNWKAGLMTFVVSAVWHGFYPGFYFFFLSAFLLDFHAKLCGEVIYPLVHGKIPGAVICLLSWLWCYAYCAYFSMSFILLSFENIYKVYSAMSWSGHILLIGSTIPLKLMAGKKKEKTSDQNKGAKPETAQKDSKVKAD